MHVIVANAAFDLPLPTPRVPVSRPALRSIQHAMRLLGLAMQGVLFFAMLWLLAAAPGFLSARDSLVPAGTGRVAHQASR